MNVRLFAVIPCAGTGTRLGGGRPKQYHKIAHHDLLYHTLAAFDACTEFAQTLVVLSADDRYFDSRRFGRLRFAVRRCGGQTRQLSVLNGLYALQEFGANDDDWVMVHDAARCGITPALIRSLVQAVCHPAADAAGGILALPLADALKHAQTAAVPPHDKNPHRKPVLLDAQSRKDLWIAQTPQMFRLGLLRHALFQAQQTRQIVDEIGRAHV